LSARPSRKAIARGLSEPIRGALRLAIREVGKHIWDNTHSLDSMRGALESVMARHPDKEGAIASAIDHAWDGIGRENGHAGWCA
jgi:hypothetical protein